MSSPSRLSFSFCRTPGLVDVLVHRARQRGLEADQVRAAVEVLDGVGEAVEVLGVALVPLQRDLDRLAVFLVADEDRLVVQRALFLFRSFTNETMPPS